jgi:inhibitor of KinA sporulation pathway (predicted exonuclease)
MTEEEQNKIADELLAYVRQEPRPRNIRPFFQDRGMSFYRFKQSAEHYNDYLKEALIMSGEMIGDLLHDKWMDFEINPSAAKSRMIGIDRDFKESLAEEKSLDQKQVETGIRLVEYKQYIDVKEEKK